jgi:hypothetical protein
VFVGIKGPLAIVAGLFGEVRGLLVELKSLFVNVKSLLVEVKGLLVMVKRMAFMHLEDRDALRYRSKINQRLPIALLVF